MGAIRRRAILLRRRLRHRRSIPQRLAPRVHGGAAGCGAGVIPDRSSVGTGRHGGYIAAKEVAHQIGPTRPPWGTGRATVDFAEPSGWRAGARSCPEEDPPP